MSEQAAIVGLVLPVATMIGGLSVDARITLLCSLLAQEICTLPPSQRERELRDVLHELPSILQSTEEGMRQALAANARDEAP